MTNLRKTLIRENNREETHILSRKNDSRDSTN